MTALLDADTERVVLEALDESIACDAPSCDAPAEWANTCPACGFTFLACSPCRAEVDATLEAYAAIGALATALGLPRRALVCRQCETPPPVVPLPWVAL